MNNNCPDLSQNLQMSAEIVQAPLHSLGDDFPNDFPPESLNSNYLLCLRASQTLMSKVV